MALEKSVKERLRTLTVETILDLRSEYLRTPGCSVLKHWDQLSDRVRASARTSATPEQWYTAMRRGLQLSSPSKASSSSSFELIAYVNDAGLDGPWLALVESEWGYLMSIARKISDERREAKQAEDDAVVAGDAPNPYDKWTVQGGG